VLARRVVDRYADRVDMRAVEAGEQRASLATFSRGDLRLRSRWEFPSESDFPSSPIYVPRRGGQPGGGDGWVVVTVLNDDGARVECFDAADVSRGPCAVLGAPDGIQLPFMLHSVWAPSASPAPDVERLAFADDVDPSAVDALDDELRVAARQVMADLSAGAAG
jgi:hypothetical protein